MTFFFMDTDIKIISVIEGTLQIIPILILILKNSPFRDFRQFLHCQFPFWGFDLASSAIFTVILIICTVSVKEKYCVKLILMNQCGNFSTEKSNTWRQQKYAEETNEVGAQSCTNNSLLHPPPPLPFFSSKMWESGLGRLISHRGTPCFNIRHFIWLYWLWVFMLFFILTV